MKIWLDTKVSARSFIDGVYWENEYEIVKQILAFPDLFIDCKGGVVRGLIRVTDGAYIGDYLRKKDISLGELKKISGLM